MTRVIVVGGGCAGTLAAAQLLDRGTGVEVVIVEARREIGPGVAYSTTDPRHLLNVPAALLGWSPAHVGDFLAWARRRDPSIGPRRFLPRALFGDYLRDVLDTAEASGLARGNRLRRLRGTVVALRPRRREVRVRLADGSRLAADHVVLAVGSRFELSPGAVAPTRHAFRTPWEPGALAPLGGGLALLVGTGLSAVDAAISLTDADPEARVVAVSRGGMLPHAHRADASPAPAPTWPIGPLTADELALGLHDHVAACRERGHDWRDVVDAVRPQVQGLWQRLSLDEQRRFRREHARRWEVRRHRMAPDVAAQVAALREAGRLEVLAGRIAGIDLQPADLGVTLLLRAPDGTVTRRDLRAARVIDCSGLDGDIARTGDPLLRQLVDGGIASIDAHGIGLRSTRDGRLRSADGDAQDRIRVIGHMRRGELWESTAVAELRQQAADAALEILGADRAAAQPA